MPQGVYPTADACAVGEQISSTGEGRHVTLYGDNLEHGSQVSYVTKGYGVWFGDHAVGMPFDTQTAALGNPLMAIDTEGIWCVDVWGQNDAGNATVVPGQQLYINTTTGLVSRISNGATHICFGYALGNVSSNATERIAVKVHFDPSLDNAKRTYYTVTDGAYTYGKHHTSIFAGGQSTGLEYFDQQVTGTQDGALYGLSTWMELAAGFTMGDLLVCFEVGLYDAGADLAAGVLVGQQWQIQPAEQPALFYNFRINNANGFPVDAMFLLGNMDSVGLAADATTDSSKNADIPFCSWGGTVYWIRLYDAAS